MSRELDQPIEHPAITERDALQKERWISISEDASAWFTSGFQHCLFSEHSVPSYFAAYGGKAIG